MLASTTTRDKRKTAAVLATVLVVVLAIAWGVMALTADGHVYRIRVLRDGKQIASYTIPQLERLDSARLKIQGKTETGPRLTTLLRDAGVKRYRAVTIQGMGVRDDGVLVLRRSQIDDRILIDIAKRGTAKVVGPDIAWGDRVRDITRIIVR